MSNSLLQTAYAPFLEELDRLHAPGMAVLDAHTHLGVDEDGQRLAPEALIGWTLRVAALAGLGDEDRCLLAGGTMAAALDGDPLPAPQPPRLAAVRTVSEPLLRVATYLYMSFGAFLGGGRPDPARLGPFVALARCVCRDPAAGPAAPALARIDTAMIAAEQLIAEGGPDALAVIGLVHACAALAATEQVAG